jgi:hypothetical protein
MVSVVVGRSGTFPPALARETGKYGFSAHTGGGQEARACRSHIIAQYRNLRAGRQCATRHPSRNIVADDGPAAVPFSTCVLTRCRRRSRALSSVSRVHTAVGARARITLFLISRTARNSPIEISGRRTSSRCITTSPTTGTYCSMYVMCTCRTVQTSFPLFAYTEYIGNPELVDFRRIVSIGGSSLCFLDEN